MYSLELWQFEPGYKDDFNGYSVIGEFDNQDDLLDFAQKYPDSDIYKMQVQKDGGYIAVFGDVNRAIESGNYLN